MNRKLAAICLLIAPLTMGVSKCSEAARNPEIGVIPKPKPTATATGVPTDGPIGPPTPVVSGNCDRVEYNKIVQEPCLMPGGTPGVSTWKMRCYSDGQFDAASGQCVSTGANEMCDPDPVSHSECKGPAQTQPQAPGNPPPTGRN